jgi:hypothetical protein
VDGLAKVLIYSTCTRLLVTSRPDLFKALYPCAKRNHQTFTLQDPPQYPIVLPTAVGSTSNFGWPDRGSHRAKDVRRATALLIPDHTVEPCTVLNIECASVETSRSRRLDTGIELFLEPMLSPGMASSHCSGGP